MLFTCRKTFSTWITKFLFPFETWKQLIYFYPSAALGFTNSPDDEECPSSLFFLLDMQGRPDCSSSQSMWPPFVNDKIMQRRTRLSQMLFFSFSLTSELSLLAAWKLVPECHASLSLSSPLLISQRLYK